ncbi:50S ribosomal protein L28 [Brachybacterium sp. GCM10030268]|uniref:50S ribosomal protein L28 n=1 Tax=Brachybacterium sp. GCM10030268 TaxID=3273382 RepID=UPI00360CDF13
MSRRCQVTGAAPSFGKNVSHSHRRTSRRFDPNIQSKRFYVPSLGRTVRLQVSTKGLRTIDRRGIEAVVAEIRRRGEKI